MFKGEKILALIPARGGSKGLTRKNILPFLGKPLIVWTIEEAMASTYLDRVIVSTDDDEIAAISKNCGAEAPFTRPAELATDDAKAIDVILHALDWLFVKNRRFDLVMVLQPTSPLRTKHDIDNAISLCFSKEAQAVISVCETSHHPYWSNILPADGCMKDFIRPEVLHKNRQELPTFYRLNGAVYLAYCDYLKETRSFYGDKTFAYIMPASRSVDIDNEIDFKLAEVIRASS
ncbi:MAG: cytidylyltransferase domain-containing protein [Nitrospirota bacterium]